MFTLYSAADTVAKTTVRSGSLAYNLIVNQFIWDMVNQIISGIFLSIMPILENTFGEAFTLKPAELKQFVSEHNPNKPLTLVVTVQEPDEARGDGFLGVTTVSKEEWAKHGIEQIEVKMQDFTAAVSNQEAVEAIIRVRQNAKAGFSSLFHCKAGKARSAMLVAVYIAAFCINPLTEINFTIKEALGLLKLVRGQVDVGKDKLIVAEQILSELKASPLYPELLKEENERKEEIESKDKKEETAEEMEERKLKFKLNSVLIDHKTKSEIQQLESFKAVQAYANSVNVHWIKTAQRTIDFINFEKMVKQFGSEHWFFNLFSIEGGELGKLAQRNPSLDTTEGSEDARKRQTLVNNFKEEILAFLSKTLIADKTAILKLTKLKPVSEPTKASLRPN